MHAQHKKRILIAPLNWGLGHATRCIPIINALSVNGYEPIIASDGSALSLLRKEFPKLQFIKLPSYQITYPKNGNYFRLKMLLTAPKMVQAIKAERKAVTSIVEDYKIGGIISDNRLGIYHKDVPCVYITHQLHVLSGSTTSLSTKLHHIIIKRFQECWVPDTSGDLNLSGKLSHTSIQSVPIKYIGPLSRLRKKKLPLKYDVMVLLSGPEPQRTIFEKKLLIEFRTYKGQVIFIKGVIEKEQHISEEKNILFYNYMTRLELEDAINQSHLILARSGYTTLMDVAKLAKNAFFIPTPGQYEQEYLAKRLTELGIVASSTQDEFTIENLESASKFKGLSALPNTLDFQKLFSLFERK